MGNITVNPSCKICHSANVSNLNISRLPKSAQPFTDFPDDELVIESNLFLCDQCGHMFLDSHPVSYYKNVIRSVSVSPGMVNYRRSQFASIKSLFSNTTSRINVLEIGAGNGQYAQLLAEAFSFCVATEKDSHVPDCRNVNFVNTHPDDADFLQMMSSLGSFDLICCFSYLEHLPEPLNSLQNIIQLLSPGGYVLLEVPNSDYIRSQGLLCEIIPDHLHYFNSGSLAALAASAQLSLKSINSTWSDYILTALLQRSDDSSSVISRMYSGHESLLKQINDQINATDSTQQIAVWGAGHQSLFIMASSILYDRVDYIVDSSSSKQSKYIPGINKKVEDPSILAINPVSLIFVICAGYNREVVSAIKKMNFDDSVRVFSIQDNKLSLELT